jgi:hypothetical protein
MGKVFAAHHPTGGTTGCLDALDGAALVSDDIALVTSDTYGFLAYLLDENSGATPVSIGVVTPLYNAGQKRWILQAINGSSALYPAAVTGLTAVVHGQNIVLSWDPAVLASGYRVSLSAVVLVDQLKGTSYTTSAVLTAGSYSFTVTGLNYFGEPSPSTAVATIVIYAPYTPTVTETLTAETVEVTWTDCKRTLPLSHYLVNSVNIGVGQRYLERVAWTGAKEFGVQAVDIAGNSGGTGYHDVPVTASATPSALTTQGLTYEIVVTVAVGLAAGETIEVWGSEVNNRATALKLGESTTGVFSHTGLDLIAAYYYWARVRDKYGNYGAWFPSSATGGVFGESSTSPTDYLTILSHQLSESELITTLNDRIDLIDTSTFTLDPILVDDNVVSGMYGAFTGLATIQATQRQSIIDFNAALILQASRIAAAQASLAGLTTTTWSAEASYSIGQYVSYGQDTYVNVQAYDHPAAHVPGDAGDPGYWTLADSVIHILSEHGERLDVIDGTWTSYMSNTSYQTHENALVDSLSAIIQAGDAVTLSAMQAEFSAVVVPAWSNTATYNTNDQVRYYTGSAWGFYRCKTDGVGGAVLPTNATYWEVMLPVATRVNAAEVDIDAANAAITDRVQTVDYDHDQAVIQNRLMVYDTDGAHAWDVGTAYGEGLIVVHDTVYYRCKAANTAKHPLSEADYWTPITAGLLSEWTLKLNTSVGGTTRVAGIGLMLDGAGRSEMAIEVGQFAIIDPDYPDALIQPFVIDTSVHPHTVGIDGNLIVSGSILADKIAADQIRIGENVTFAPGATIDWTKVSGGPNTTHIDAQGIYTGTLTAAQVNAVELDASRILTGSLNADLITTGALNASLITTGTLNASLITTGTLNADLITAGTLNVAHIETGSITAEKIKPADIDTAQLKDGSVTNINYDFDPGPMPFYYGSDTTLINVPLVVTGKPVWITFCCQSDSTVMLKLWRGGDLLYTTVNTSGSFSWVDVPPEGTHSYIVTGRDPNSESESPQTSQLTLILMEIKK